MLLSQMTDQIGRVLGDRYRLLKPIGTGSSAQVFVAADTRLQRRVAVKILHPALADDQTFLRRFRAEAQASAKLNHQNIVKLLDSADDDGPYLVTELVDGGSLRAMLDAGERLTLAQALDVGLQAARGLDFAHRQGFVHRDIKPANLLFSHDGRLRIADFGVARALAEAAWTEPSGAVLGTARYASPEQAKGQPVTGKGDVYSLGLVLIEAVTGQVPFAADTTIGTLMARVDAQVELDDELGPLVEALEWATEPDPEQRPAADELVGALLDASSELDAPDPLPLVGLAGSDSAPFVDPDPTRLPEGDGIVVVAPDEPADAEARGAALAGLAARARKALDARRAAGSTDLVVAAGTTQVPEATNAEDPAGADAGGGPSRTDEGRSSGPVGDAGRRRVPRAVLVAGAVVLLVGLVVGAMTVRELLRPSHEVPGLTGRDVGDLAGAVEGTGWTVERVHTRQDGTTQGEIVDQDPAAGEQLREGRTFVVTVSRGPELVAVPDNLGGLTQGEAAAALEAVGLRPGAVSEKWGELVPAGIVLGESLFYTEVPEGSLVPLVVSKGPRPRVIPEGLAGAGLGFDEVASRLRDVQLEPVRGEDFSDTVPEGQVIGTSPAGGTSVPRDSEVVVIVSKGPQPVIIPDLAGESVADAQAALESRGLVVDGVDGPPNGVVTGTDPAAGLQVDAGSSITLITRRRGGGNGGDD